MKKKYSFVRYRVSRRFAQSGLMLASILAALTGFSNVNAQSISMNFGSNETNGSINTGSSLTAGAIPIAGTFWNNMSGNTQGTAQALNNSAGAASGAAVTWSSANTWRSGSPGGTATSLNGNLTKGYLDDGGASGNLITVTNVPYLTYNVYVIQGSDQGGATENTNSTYRPITVNGTFYKGNNASGTLSTSTVVGNGQWTGKNWTDDNVLVEGSHYLRVANQSSPTLTIQGGTGGGRGPIAGVQVENSYTGTVSYWDTDNTTPGAGGATPSGNWADNNWGASQAGDATTAAWTSGNAAAFSAGTTATGAYTVTVAGSQTADALWVQDGTLTLDGGTVALSGSRIIRVDSASGANLVLNSTLSADGAVSSSGTYSFGAAQTINTTFTQTTGTLSSSVTNTVASGGNLIIGTGGALNSPLTVDVGGTLTVAPSTTVLFNAMVLHASTTINGTLAKAGGGTTTLTSTLPATPLLAIQGGTFQLGNNDTSGDLSGATSITVASGASLSVNRTDTVTINTPISGAGNLNKNAAGTLTRSSGTDSHTGSTNLNTGTLALSGTGSISGTTYFGNPTSGTATTLTVADTANLAVNGFMTLGDQTNATITVNQTGGTVSNSGTTNNPAGNSMSNRWGHWGGGATVYNISAGSLSLTGAPLYLSWDGAATLNVSGTGVVNLLGVEQAYGARANASTININGGTLNIGASGITSNGAAGAANKVVNLNGGTLGALANWSTIRPMTVVSNSTIDTTGGNITLLGALGGTTGGLTITGGKTATLAAGTYTGNTTVTGNTKLHVSGALASTVAVTSGSTVAPGTIAAVGTGAAAAATLDAGSNSSFRVSVASNDLLNVTGNLDVPGAHTLTVIPSGDIPSNTTFTVIDYGTATAGSYANINVVGSTPRLNLVKEPDDGSTIKVKVTGFDAMIWKGNDGTNPTLWDVNTTTNWLTSFSNVAGKFLANDVVIFDDSAAEFNVALTGTIAPVSTTFNNDSNDYTLSGDPITTGSITKNSLAKVTLTNNNTYPGPTVINDGTLQIGNGTSGSIAVGSPVTVGSELILNLAAGGTYANATSGSGGLISIIGTGNMTFNPVIPAQVLPAVTSSVSLDFNRDGTVYCNSQNQTTGSVTINDGIVAFDGAQQANRLATNKTVTVNANGTMAILGVNALPTAANSVNVNLVGGTLAIISGGSNATGATGQSHAHVRDVTMNGGTMVLDYSGTGTAYNGESVQLNNTLFVVGTAASSINYGMNATLGTTGLSLNGNRTFDVSDVTSSSAADLTVNVEIQDNDSAGDVLTKQGLGKMVLAGENTYSGGNEVLAGTLCASSVTNNAAGGIGSGYLAVKNGATFQYTGSGAETTTRLLWIDNGAANMDITNAAANLTWNPAGGAISAPLVKLGDGTLTLGGIVSGAATVTVNDGTLALTAVNTHTGATTVNAGGTLVVNGTSIADASRLDVNTGGTVNVTGNETVHSLYYGGTQQLPGTYGATGSGATYIDDTRYSGTGTITVVTGPYDSWAAANGLTAGVNNGAAQDPDDDNIANLLEYVLGGNPLTSSQSILPASTVSGGNLILTFKRSDLSEADTTQVVQYGSDLVGWTDVAIGAASAGNVTIVENGAGEDDVTVTIATGTNTKFFARLSVTKN